MYLRETEVPTLAYYYDEINNKLSYKWQSDIKNQDKLVVYYQNAELELKSIKPTINFQIMDLGERDNPLFKVSNTGYIKFKRLNKAKY
jgi:hypothetical protein